ncbi:class I SAM-dependent methyltransferase [Planobispora rosea]|uniref:class I SAM-dependent methyltransferase n=1 Tax=Planobispora rosea TaxID=35762 RepID=UPI00083B5BB4|nr:class I SAM-dependent methyltransferase [Planobispora rosea]
MPCSDNQGKDWALATYLTINPSIVIDIGPGAGTYARLMRPHHEARWIGIEAWGPYIADYGLDDLYDIVHVADARLVDWTWFPTTDLVIIGDVLEHMTTLHACVLLERLKRTADNLLVSIPVLHLDQDAVNGNPFERHIDHWTYEGMLNELGAGVVDTWHGDVLAYYWWMRP